MEFTKVGCLELFSRRTPLKEGGRRGRRKEGEGRRRRRLTASPLVLTCQPGKGYCRTSPCSAYGVVARTPPAVVCHPNAFTKPCTRVSTTMQGRRRRYAPTTHAVQARRAEVSWDAKAKKKKDGVSVFANTKSYRTFRQPRRTMRRARSRQAAPRARPRRSCSAGRTRRSARGPRPTRERTAVTSEL